MVVLLFLSYVLGGVVAISIVVLSILLYRPVQGMLSRIHRNQVLAIAYVSLVMWLVLIIMPGNPPGFEWAFLAVCLLAVLNLKGR
jgi:inner membrane protein involved in colicin E2 resistance